MRDARQVREYSMHGCLFLYPLTIIQVHKLNYQKNGHFIRPDSTFRNSVSSDPSSQFPAEKGRYTLCVTPLPLGKSCTV
jgi:hypothetical protein